MDDEENPTLLHSVSIRTLRKVTSVSPLCPEDTDCCIDAQPADAVTWRGGFDICNQESNRKIHGLKAHLSNKACSKVCDMAVKIPKLLSVEIVPRLNTWPKRFSESPPTDDHIAIYIFPEDESHEQVFNNFVDEIICGDLALKSFVDNSGLLLFTSLQLPMQHRRFQGKIYLWGVFKGKSASASYQSNDQIAIQSACANSVAAAIVLNRICTEDKANSTGTSNGVPIPTKVIYIDMWEHGKPVGKGKQGIICNYCNQVYVGRVGIARFQKHLAGGYRKWHVKGCLKVPKEVEEAMKETLEAKAILKMKKLVLVDIGVSEELEGGYQRFEMRTHHCESDYAVHLKDTVPISTSVLPEQGVPILTKEININVWEHGKSTGKENPGITCNYCNHVYFGRLGMARLKKHLAGGGTKWFVKGCPKVPKEVEEAMKDTLKENTKKLIQIGVSKELKGPSGATRWTRVKPRCRCCVTSKTPPKKRKKGILSGAVATLNTNLDEESSRKKAHECQNVESEVRHVNEKQKNKVVKKANKGRGRGAKGGRGITAISSTSNLLGEGGNTMDRIQQGDEIIKALPQFLIPKKSKLPAEKVAEPPILAPENILNSSVSPVMASRLPVPDVQLTPSTVSAQIVGDKASQLGTTSVPQGDQTVLPLPLFLVEQQPELLPAEKVAEPQILAAENTTNSASTPVAISRLSAPDVQLEDISVTSSTFSAQNARDKASQLGTTCVPQGDHLRSLSTNYEFSDQSTDLSFLDIVHAVNELAESACTDSEHASVIQVGQYTVNHDLGETLQAIFEKYGDIAQGSPIQSSSGRSLFLGALCEVLNQLQDIRFAGCHRHHLQSLHAAVTTAESVGLDVSWLHQRYDDLKTTLKGIKKYSALETDLAKAEAVAESRKKKLDSKKADMARLQCETETLNGQLASLQAETEDLESKMSSVCLKAKRFCHKNLADGLL